jgi:flagellin
MDVASVTNAQDAIDKIDAAINDVDTTRATMGAAQNRLESTIANLENSVQNLTESRARIKDADIAKQAAEQTQNNVRRQAAASVLTQANQNPQLALQLLGG